MKDKNLYRKKRKRKAEHITHVFGNVIYLFRIGCLHALKGSGTLQAQKHS